MTNRSVFIVLGLACVLGGLFMPTGWYDQLPTKEGFPPEAFRGVLLLQASLVVEGLVLCWLAYRGFTFVRIDEGSRFSPPPSPVAPVDSRLRWALASVTALGLLLRLYDIDADLWLDEISPIQDYVHLSPLEVIGSFMSTNNHLLNTLLVQLSTTLFGESEWSVRLPAVLFGAASIPVVYWVARLALGRWESLGAATLLAVSYHHIFFSQNARGYSAYIFFALVASRLFIDGLRDDRARTWLLYGLVSFLGFAALLNTAFVLAAHGIVGLVALWFVHKKGGSPWPLFRRLAVVFAVTGFLVFQLYATILPKVVAFISVAYSDAGSGFSLFSGAFFKELLRGLSAGFGPGLLLGAIPFLVLVAAGYLSLWRKHWVLALTLVLPLALTGSYLVVKGLTFSPRFFILGLPLAMITAIPSLRALSDLATRLLRRPPEFAPRLCTALVGIVALLSATSLTRYYAVPKQSYRAAFAALKRQLGPNDIVITIFNAERGTRYYGPRFGLVDDKNTFHVRSVAALDEVLAAHPGQTPHLVLTFPRSLHYFDPDLEARIRSNWVEQERFPASVGDGEITLWAQKP